MSAVAAVLLISIIVLLVFKPTLKLTPFKSAFEAPLTAFMERPITVEGVWLRPGKWVRIRFTDLSIEAAGSDPDGVFAHAQEVELELAVVSLLKSQIRLRALTARGFDFDIRQNADGTGNWPVWTTFTYEIVDLLGIDLVDTKVHFSDEESGQRHEVVLDRLLAGIGRDTPLSIDLEGRLNGQTVSHKLTGPTFQDLDGESEWPVSAAIHLSGTSVHVEGMVGGAEEAPGFDLGFSVHSEEIGEIAAAAGADAMEIGSLDLTGRLAGADETYRLADLAGEAAGTKIEGSLTLDLRSNIPSVQGGFGLGHLDASTWVDGVKRPNGATTADTTGLENLLPALNAVNARMSLAVDRLSLPDTDLDDIELEIAIENGVLTVPIDLRFGSSPVQGLFSVEEADGLPRLVLDLGVDEVYLGALGSEDVGGSVGRLDVGAETHGTVVNDLIDNLQFNVRGNKLAVTVQNADTGVFEVPIRSVTVVQKPGTGIWATARGRHVETPFTIEVSTTNLMRLMDGGTLPVSIAARGGGGAATFRGRVRPFVEAPAVDIRFAVEGEAIGELAPWIGVSPEAAHPYAVKGRLDTMNYPPRLVIEDGVVGSSSVTADITLRDGDEDQVIVVRIDSPLIDLEELTSLRPPVEEPVDEDELAIHDQVIPTGLYLPDAEVEISIGRINHGDLDLGGISSSLRSREGHLETSPFNFTLEEQPISGLIFLDLRSDTPEVDVFVSTVDLDEEDIEDGFDLESLPETTIGRVSLDLELRGATLNELQNDSYVSIVVEDMHTVLSNPASEDHWEISISHLQADALYGKPARIAATGSINGEPVDLLVGFSMTDLETFAQDGAPVHLVLKSGDTGLDLEGILNWPIDPHNLSFHVLLDGENLADLDPLLGTALPEIGPYAVDGHLTVSERNYDLSDLHLMVGESSLRGEVGFFEGAERPIIVGHLVGHRPRLEDFFPETDEEEETPEKPGPASASDEQGPVLDPELLRIVDGNLSFDVTGFEWGDRGPGAGEFRLQLDDGNLTTTVFWDQPNGGYINARLDLDSDGEVVDAVLNADIDHMSYGPLGFLLHWESPEGGVLSLDTTLKGSGTSLDEILQSIKGHLDFTSYPEGHHAAAFNLWGGQLIDTLLPVFGAEKKQSKLNCTVGELDIADGRVVPRKFIMDASRTRVKGKGEIDYRNNRIQIKATPRPKRRGFISLATPVHIFGALDDPDIRVDTGGLAVTALRVTTWVVTVWLELFKKQLPVDGSDICVDPTPRTAELSTATNP